MLFLRFQAASTGNEKRKLGARVVLAYILGTVWLAVFPTTWAQSTWNDSLNVGDSISENRPIGCMLGPFVESNVTIQFSSGLFWSNANYSGQENPGLTAGAANHFFPAGKGFVQFVIKSTASTLPGIWYQSTLARCVDSTNTGAWAQEWQTAVTLKPVISGGTTAWYMGTRGPSDPIPAQYGPAQLQASPSPANLSWTNKSYSYTWTMPANNCLVFDNSQYTETTTDNTVSVIANCATTGSTPVTVEVNGVTSDPWNVQAHGPGAVVRTQTEQVPNPQGEIWETYIHYTAYDNFGLLFPYPIPMNEDYVSPQPVTYSYPNGRFWPNYYANGGHDGPTITNSAFEDQLNVYALAPSLLNPTPTPLQNPMSTTLAFEFRGTYNFGSAKQGYGSCVQSLIWEYFVDHGDQAYPLVAHGASNNCQGGPPHSSSAIVGAAIK